MELIASRADEWQMLAHVALAMLLGVRLRNCCPAGCAGSPRIASTRLSAPACTAPFAALETFLDSAEADAMKHSDLERELEARGRERMRTLLQAHLDARGARSRGGAGT